MIILFSPTEVKGGFRFCSVYYYFAGQVNELEDLSKAFEAKYNESGNIVKLTDYGLNGKVQSKTLFKYSENGKITKIIKKYSNKQFVKSTFNENENIISEIYYNSNESIKIKDSYKNNSEGKNIECVRYDSRDSIKLRWQHAYDDNSNESQCLTFNPDGSLVQRKEYKYDGTGKIKEEELYNELGILVLKYSFNYNENGNPVEIIGFDRNNNFNRFKFTCKFDENNNKIDEVFESIPSISNLHPRTTYQYDEFGNLTKESSYNKFGKLLRETIYVYEYEKFNLF